MAVSTLDKAAKMSKLFTKIINSKIDVSKQFKKMVTMLSEQMGVDASACFLVVDDNYLELFASDGECFAMYNGTKMRTETGFIKAPTLKNAHIS